MIYVGYQGIGKSSLASKDTGYIDLESGNLWYKNEDGEDRRDSHWYKLYVNFAIHLAEQGYNVFVSSHKIVREELNKRGADFVVICPDKSLKDEWLTKLHIRYMVTDKIKDYKAYMNAKEMFDDNIDDLMQEKHVHLIKDKDYILQNEIKMFYTNYES